MKYLRKFNESLKKAKKAPDNFIELKSINSYLDPINAVIYKKSTIPLYYNEEDVISVQNYLELGDDISNDDVMVIETLSKSMEPIVKDKIDWDLIQSIKDLSLDYLDEEYRVQIIVYVKMFKVYTESISHVGSWNTYEDYFYDTDINAIESLSNNTNSFYYKIRILKPYGDDRFTFCRELGIEFVEKLKDYLPEYTNNIQYSLY